MEKTENLILISLDAISSNDFEYIKNLKGFRELLENGSYVKNVESIYPSLTYPVHATIVTGRYPKDHGVISNKKLEICKHDKDWYWYRKAITGDTIYDSAKRKGLKTASILWPVTGGADIDYNIPEIWSNKPFENQAIKSLRAGSFMYTIEMEMKFGKMRKGFEEPFLDDYVTATACETIKSKRPNLLMMHLIDLDTQRHKYGTNSKEAKEALNRLDKRLQDIINTLKECNLYDKTTIMAFGDHSQLDAKKEININSLFLKEGLIELDEKGNIKDYKAYLFSLDGSAYIYIKDKEYSEKVEDILNKLKHDNIIENIFKKDEAEKLGANYNCDFMIEALKGYYFSEDIKKETVCDYLSRDGKGKVTGQHGYIPSKNGYTTMFIASGPSIKRGIEVEWGSVINYAPTIAKVLGLEINAMAGEEFKDILV